MTPQCCDQWFALGESVCPVCRHQSEAHRDELADARAYRPRVAELSDCAQELVGRRAVGPADVGCAVATSRMVAVRNPARRAVFRLLGFYLPESEARDLLRRIHEYKWIEAEKAGRDIWVEAARSASPLEVAARNWASRYLDRHVPASVDRQDRAA